jgi:hypothetical protein
MIVMTASACELDEEIAHLRDLDLRGVRADGILCSAGSRNQT